MNDVELRHVAKLRAKRGARGVVILTVIEDAASFRRSRAVEGVHQRGFARAGTAHDRDKFAAGYGERDVIEQDFLLVAVLYQVEGVDANAPAAALLDQLGAGKDEIIRTDADHVPRLERVAGNALAVDIDVVGAVLVNKAVGRAGAFQLCVIARHLRVVQHNGIAGAASDGDQRRAQ